MNTGSDRNCAMLELSSDPSPPQVPTGLALLQKTKDAMTGNSLQQKVLIKNLQGLHMRPILSFVETANRFQSKVQVSKGDKRVDGASQLQLMLLGAEQGTELLLEVSGPDAEHALRALIEVVDRFVEEDQLPPPKG